MRALQIVLVLASLGVTAVMAREIGELRAQGKRNGIVYRRERRRAILTAIFSAGMLMWPALYLAMPAPPGRWLYMLPLMWPLLMIGCDLTSARTYVPAQATMEGKSMETRNNGNLIIGAVFASGMLLAVLNKTSNGHLPQSAKVMLLGMLGIIAFLLPSPGTAPVAEWTWATYAAQRVVLHSSIGMFVLAVVLAWCANGAC